MVKFREKESRIVVTKGWSEGIGDLLFNWYRVLVWGHGKVLQMESGDGCTKM